jgi:hypothetical protein
MSKQPRAKAAAYERRKVSLSISCVGTRVVQHNGRRAMQLTFSNGITETWQEVDGRSQIVALSRRGKTTEFLTRKRGR